MHFMLGSDATLQIHFIDIIAIAAVESDTCRLARDVKQNRDGYSDATAWRNDQP